MAQFASRTLYHFNNHLLHPDDWFSFWRLNCQVVAYHSNRKNTLGYKQEDKWTFLKDGRDLGVPVSPFMDLQAIVCKNKNIEGGMGIHFYSNATVGGDWIIQEKLENAEWLNQLLPSNAPLSTLRIITASSWSLDSTWNEVDAALNCSNSFNRGVVSKGSGKGVVENETGGENRQCFDKGDDGDDDDAGDAELLEARLYVRALSGVLRLGRQGASTDHSSVLFDVDVVNQNNIGGKKRPCCSGKLGEGTTNRHWYVLGPSAIRHCPWLPPTSYKTHPDYPNPIVTGKSIPDINEAVDIVTRAHMKMMRDVPLVGWDVAFTTKGICLLEVNLSCNFFRGSFDIPKYLNFVEQFWKKLDQD